MAQEPFFGIAANDRAEALQVAAAQSGRPVHVLEKDVWVVWTLSALFDSPFAKDLVFKGGTSLSKAYHAIERFSEDIDVTYDIRAIAPDLIKGAPEGDEPLPVSKSQGRKWSEEIRHQRLPAWVNDVVASHLQEKLTTAHLEASIQVEKENLLIDYAALASGYGYVSPRVRIEFGARSTGEPAEDKQITCDAAPQLPSVSFPTASVRVMRVERTIWEKMTAIHVFCLQGDISDRQARHWYDIAMLDEAGFVDGALKDRDIANRVAQHKSWFFPEKDPERNAIDYNSVINGNLILVPEENALKSLATDYDRMVTDGLFLGEPKKFEWIIERCRGIEKRANATKHSGKNADTAKAQNGSPLA